MLTAKFDKPFWIRVCRCAPISADSVSVVLCSLKKIGKLKK
jgi:hypothetical protein